MHKLTSEEVELLQDMCLDDSTKIIRYLDKKFEEQDKQNRKNIFFYSFIHNSCVSCCTHCNTRYHSNILITIFNIVTPTANAIIKILIAINSMTRKPSSHWTNFLYTFFITLLSTTHDFSFALFIISYSLP